jgi:hypothetical protein
MKLSIIKPLYKNGSKYDMTNYRPVSLLISFSKIFEKVVQARLLEHLTTHNILRKEQNGFKSNLTTENVTFTLTDDILNAVNYWLEAFFVT